MMSIKLGKYEIWCNPSNGDSIIGITGTLNYLPHEIRLRSISKFFPLAILCVYKPSYYYLGFGKKIKEFPLKFEFNLHPTNLSPKQVKFKVHLQWEWLYNYMTKHKK